MQVGTSPLSWKLAALGTVLSIALLAGPAGRAESINTFTDQGLFQAALKTSATENFDGLPANNNFVSLPMTTGAFNYTIQASGDSVFIVQDPANPLVTTNMEVSTNSGGVDLQFEFAPGINALGGSFFATDAAGFLTPGDITLMINGDPTTAILIDPTVFNGIISNTDILSLDITPSVDPSNPQSIQGIFATADNLTFGVGTAALPVTTPEPGSIVLMLGGIAVCAFRARSLTARRSATKA